MLAKTLTHLSGAAGAPDGDRDGVKGKQKTSRRQFLKTTGAGLAGVTLSFPARAATASVPAIPAHKLLAVPGVHLYADEQSVAAGQPIRFHVSSSVPYVLSVCRLGLQVDDPAGDEVLHEFPREAGVVQPIHPGSYVHIEKEITEPVGALSLECWVRPWKLRGLGGLISQMGFGLF